ncbi:MAG TPA: ATP-binding protein [Gemmataceae bacterium]|nr:ATP-binding protein [Gemmataceae bacterium]
MRKSEADLIALLPEAEGFLKGHGASAQATSRVLIILEEVVLNLVKYATGSVTQDIDVRLEVAHDRVVVEVADDGAPFDPRGAPEFDKTKPLEERRPGGMGIQIVRNIAKEIHYERVADRNHLQLVVANP